MYEPRFYRQQNTSKFEKFHICYKETDLLIFSPLVLKELCFQEIRKLRLIMDDYIMENQVFANSLLPIEVNMNMPSAIVEMVKASTLVGVGPMAAVAGVFAEKVGEKVLQKTDQVIIENGGDVFLKLKDDIKIGVYAGKESPFSDKLAIKVKARDVPWGICSSSGKMGHSYSEGKADLVTVISESTPLADAAATAAANKVHTKDDIASVIEWIYGIEGIKGVLIIKDDKIGVQGEMELLKR